MLEHYDALDEKTKVVDWRKLSWGLIVDHVPGFQIKRPKPSKKRDAGAPPTKASRDLVLLGLMQKLISRGKSARNAALIVYRDHPDLGSSAEAIRRRWIKLRDGGPELWRAMEIYVQLK